MAFNFSAFSYIIALILDAFLIFFSLFHVIAFDELKTDYKNPIDQCNSLNPVRLCAFNRLSTDEKRVILCTLRTPNLAKTTDQLQLLDRVVLFVSAGPTRILAAPLFQRALRGLRGMVVVRLERPADSVPHKQVPFAAHHVRTRPVRSDEHNERGGPDKVPT